MHDIELTIQDRLLLIKESIDLIHQWSNGVTEVHQFMISPNGVMAFNACVMRLQVIGEEVGKLLKSDYKPLAAYPDIPWKAIYNMRNLISHEYANINEYKVMNTITNDLEPLKQAVEDMLGHYSQCNGQACQ